MNAEPLQSLAGNATTLTNDLSSRITNRLDDLLMIADYYRNKYDTAKTKLARDLYKKKLVKAVNHIDGYMSLISSKEEIND